MPNNYLIYPSKVSTAAIKYGDLFLPSYGGGDSN